MILEPEHKRLNGCEITDSEADAHYASVEDIYEDESRDAGAEFYRKAGADHAGRKAYDGNK